MAKIIEVGTIPAPPVPWYLAREIICLHCKSRYELEAADFDGDERGLDAPWTVVTERRPNGRSVATGPCPVCQRTATIERIT